MKITEKSSGISKDVLIQLLEKEDLGLITPERFSFDWKKQIKHNEVYKLALPPEHRILGLISLEHHPAEERIEINYWKFPGKILEKAAVLKELPAV
jgi:hypothetical protein